MNEIVKYNNELNKVSFTGFTKTHMDLLMAICAKAKSRGTDEIVIKTHELKEITRFEKGGGRDFFDELDAMTDQLQHVNGKIVDRTPGQRKFVKFTLFPTFKFDETGENLRIKVNSDFAWLLNEFENYTTFELTEFIGLKSKYSKSLYRLLKQWRTVGKYVFHDLVEFKELMDVPKSYSNKYMMERCVDVAIEEISRLDGSFKGFKCSPKYAKKRGKPLESLIFTWQAEKPKQIDNAPLEGQQTFDDQDFQPDIPVVIADEDIKAIMDLMAEKGITEPQAKSIIQSAEGDLELIKQVYQDKKDTEVRKNFVGLMITLVKPGVYQSPTKYAAKSGFNNFEGRSADPASEERYYKLVELAHQPGGLTAEEQAEFNELARRMSASKG